MELYKQLLIHLLEKEEIQVYFPQLDADIQKMMEQTCYQALQKIKNIIENGDLTDEECFERIEEIVCVFEELGSDGGGRHDFG